MNGTLFVLSAVGLIGLTHCSSEQSDDAGQGGAGADAACTFSGAGYYMISSTPLPCACHDSCASCEGIECKAGDFCRGDGQISGLRKIENCACVNGQMFCCEFEGCDAGP